MDEEISPVLWDDNNTDWVLTNSDRGKELFKKCYWVEWPTIGQCADEVPTHRNRVLVCELSLHCACSRVEGERGAQHRLDRPSGR